MFGGIYNGKTVLVTGHTGFKGTWLCEWLLSLGAKVVGYALQPPTKPSLFESVGLSARIEDQRADICDPAAVQKAVQRTKPDIIFHLAAQPLVRESYEKPLETFQTNILGTVHVLEAARQLERLCAVVVVTTDKCYHNREWLYGYREDDPLGGRDPYSASKACAELVVASYQASFGVEGGLIIASARAGNVIGGGDFAVDRIVPDTIGALRRGESIGVRNPNQVRPWQHVLEPLAGYLWLGAVLSSPNLLDRSDSRAFQSAFNFGPHLEANRTVRDLVDEILQIWPGSWHSAAQPGAPHEAGMLNLAIDKAIHLLGWRPVWDFARAVKETIAWYRCYDRDAGLAASILREQIGHYSDDARRMSLPWARSS